MVAGAMVAGAVVAVAMGGGVIVAAAWLVEEDACVALATRFWHAAE